MLGVRFIGFIALTVLFALLSPSPGRTDLQPPFFEGQKSQSESWPGISMPVSGPSGVLIKIWNGSDTSSTGNPCWDPKAEYWSYSPDDFSVGETLYLSTYASRFPPWDQRFVTASYALHHPPRPPFSFQGWTADGQQACGRDDAIAFFAPSDNTYRITFGLASGGYSYRIDGYGYGEWTPVRSTTARDVALKQGAHSIEVRQDDYGDAAWTISGDDFRPEIREPLSERLTGAAGQDAKFSFYSTAGVRLDVSILRDGALVRSLISQKVLAVGGFSFVWDGRLIDGTPVPEGDYTVRASVVDWRGRSASHDFPYRVVVAPFNTSLPVLSGLPEVGQTLRAGAGSWSGTQPLTYSYRWQRCDSLAYCEDVEGATFPYYVLGQRDRDWKIRVVVSATNAGGSVSATSAMSQTVQDPPPPPPPPPPPDRQRPFVRALASVGIQGRPVRLSYRVADNSGKTRDRITVLKGRRRLAGITTALSPSLPGHTYRFMWRAPRRVRGQMKFCVRAYDTAGNRSLLSCARLVIRPSGL